MKKLNKSLLVAGSIMTIGVGSLGLASVASAANDSAAKSSGIVDKLVAKFGLNKSEVQAVFDAERTEHQAERTKIVSDKLAEAVKAGTITQAQSDLIQNKIKEFQANREANHEKMESMTKEERKAAMEAEREALKTWISENKIPEELTRLLRGGGKGHGMMHMSESSESIN